MCADYLDSSFSNPPNPTSMNLMLRTLPIVPLFMAATMAFAQNTYRQTINLAGTWLFGIEPDTVAFIGQNIAMPLADTVSLPGTTDTKGKGTPLTRFDETTHLSRRYNFEGVAYYRREVTIPKSWRNKTVLLTLERTKDASVFVDGMFAGNNCNISTAQTYNLTKQLKPGKHTIAIAVDNSHTSGIPEQIFTSSHAATEDTQTNWNGIIGRIELQARPKTWLSDLHLFEGNTKTQCFTFCVNSEKKLKGKYTIRVKDLRTGKELRQLTRNIELDPQSQHYVQMAQTDVSLEQWSDENPAMYGVSVTIEGADSIYTTFAIRDFRAQGPHFTINGKKTFLRGKHDACVFPLTAHVPMDRESWRRYFATLKEYGINHVRFHSWCPPEECFSVADEMGFYLQPELPFWGDFNANDSKLMEFLHNEGEQILQQYGSHPSFVMFALGNELWGSIDEMKRFADDFRNINPEKLYTFGSNYYLGYKGTHEGMDYFTTCRNGGEVWGEYNTHTRGSFSFADAKDGGIINHEYPNTLYNLNQSVKDTKVPIISHETGQFQCFPDFNEIQEYNGVTRPCNLETFRQRLNAAGMGSQAHDFLMASGHWAVELYKADIELDLRTRDMAGFQLLDLQDYPGQGSAYVGILNSLMQSKHLVSAERWREWCAPVVPLIEIPRFCYTDGDTLCGNLKIASYTTIPYKREHISWRITDANGNTRLSGNNTIPAQNESGLISAGYINAPLHLTDRAHSEQFTLTLSIEGTPYRNSWRLWVYPKENYTKQLTRLSYGITICDSLTEDIVKKLEKGASVLLMPHSTMYQNQTVGGLFQTDYWNYRMFRTICENNKKQVSPGTLGLLIDDKHPLFCNFPTAEHTDWQWRDMAHEARPLILDRMPEGCRPIVQVIDNVERNHRLGLVFELSVGKGRLLVCMADMARLDEHPESRRFHLALLEYMHSKAFAPSTKLTVDKTLELFNGKAIEKNISELHNISFE